MSFLIKFTNYPTPLRVDSVKDRLEAVLFARRYLNLYGIVSSIESVEETDERTVKQV